MNRKVFFVVLVVFSLSLVAAHGDYYESDYVFKEKISETEYFPRQNRVVVTTTYIDYENEDRFPTYDYRHGYTYRATKEYRDSYRVKKKYGKSYSKKYYEDNWDEKMYYKKYVPYKKNWKKKSCYESAPRGKLFYFC